MSKKIEKLRKQAQAAFAKSDYVSALKSYQELVRLQPADIKNWVRMGDTLRAQDKGDKAINIYQKAAAQYALKGFLLQAIGVNKMILEIDPNHTETQAALADLYARKEGDLEKRSTVARVKLEKVTASAVSAPPDPGEDTGDSTIVEETVMDQTIASSAEDLATENPGDNLYQQLPDTPLFSSLSPDEFQDVVAHLQLRQFDRDEPILNEGDKGDSFYVICEGRANVVKLDQNGLEVHLATLNAGDFFGEFAFITGGLRTASVVSATESTLFEFTQDGLMALIDTRPEISHTLEEFYKRRLVGTLLKISPVFQPMSDLEREQILNFFTYTAYPAGTTLIKQGNTSEKFFIIVTGQIEVKTAGPDRSEVLVATLSQGDFIGEISIMTDRAATANCVTKTDVRVYEMESKIFRELIGQFPDVDKVIRQIARDRISELKDIRQTGMEKAGLV